jgi:predicted nucleotidyltransferase
VPGKQTDLKLSRLPSDPRLALVVEQIVMSLIENHPDIGGVCLFGSVARGDFGAGSDIDLLVVGSDESLSPSELMGELPPNLRDREVSLIYYPKSQLKRLADDNASFLLHIQQEGQVIIDRTGDLTAAMNLPIDVREAVRSELDIEQQRLGMYDELERFGDNYLFVLMQLYAIGRSIVILALSNEGVFEYRRDRIFKLYAEQRPELASDIEVVKSLEPFYRLVVKDDESSLPFGYHGSRSKVEEALAATLRIVEFEQEVVSAGR